MIPVLWQESIEGVAGYPLVVRGGGEPWHTVSCCQLRSSIDEKTKITKIKVVMGIKRCTDVRKNSFTVAEEKPNGEFHRVNGRCLLSMKISLNHTGGLF